MSGVSNSQPSLGLPPARPWILTQIIFFAFLLSFRSPHTLTLSSLPFTPLLLPSPLHLPFPPKYPGVCSFSSTLVSFSLETRLQDPSSLHLRDFVVVGLFCSPAPLSTFFPHVRDFSSNVYSAPLLPIRNHERTENPISSSFPLLFPKSPFPVRFALVLGQRLSSHYHQGVHRLPSGLCTDSILDVLRAPVSLPDHFWSKASLARLL